MLDVETEAVVLTGSVSDRFMLPRQLATPFRLAASIRLRISVAWSHVGADLVRRQVLAEQELRRVTQRPELADGGRLVCAGERHADLVSPADYRLDRRRRARGEIHRRLTIGERDGQRRRSPWPPRARRIPAVPSPINHPPDLVGVVLRTSVMAVKNICEDSERFMPATRARVGPA